MSARSIAEALAKIVGSDHVVSDPARLAAAAIDGITPRWLIRVSAIEQVSAVLALASDIPPRGSTSCSTSPA